MKLSLLTTAAFLALSTGAMAADAIDAKIQELFNQGYTHFEVKRGLTSAIIDAYGANLPALEMRVSSTSGAVLSQSTETSSAIDHSGDIARITATASASTTTATPTSTTPSTTTPSTSSVAEPLGVEVSQSAETGEVSDNHNEGSDDVQTSMGATTSETDHVSGADMESGSDDVGGAQTESHTSENIETGTDGGAETHSSSETSSSDHDIGSSDDESSNSGDSDGGDHDD